MQSGISTPPLPPPQTSRPRESGERFIDRQLHRTRWQLKIVDLCTALAALSAGLLMGILVLVVIDHWLFDLGFWGRSLGFAVLLLGAGAYASRTIVPLLFRPINPVYAARTIEESSPSLKNSLINFLSFRPRRTAVPEMVFVALQDRAATDLRSVPLENVVDRSRLIHVGCTLAGVFLVCAIYVVVSPKDPFSTVARVATPWVSIARPSRVEISDIRPGDSEVFQGQEVIVTARVRGAGRDDPVTLTFSTADQQIENHPVAMRPDQDGKRYECTLPPGGLGVQQEIVYRLRAGDATSRDYRLTVSPSPVILLERLEYDFPAYTKRNRVVVERQGNIKTLEGTRVTIHARTNYPIRSASLDFQPGPLATAHETGASTRSERLPMEFRDQTAWRNFLLKRSGHPEKPSPTSYQLAFVTRNGDSSPNSILYSIEVIPDLSPDVEILTPTRNHIEVPEDGQQKIEIRALDPDFALRQVRLRVVVGGDDLLDQALLKEGDRTGQVVVEYTFRPRQLGLVAGNEVVFWAVAEDNRTSPDGSVAEPNTERTRNYHLVVTPPSKEPRPEAQPESKGEEEGTSKPTPQPKGKEGQDGTGGQSPSSEAAMPSQGQSGRENPGNASKTLQNGQSDAADSNATSSSDPSKSQGSDSKNASSSQPKPSAANDSASQEGQNASRNRQSSPDQPANQRTEPLHDGEVFEKALEHLQRKQETDTIGDGTKQAGAAEPTSKSAEGGQPKEAGGDPNRSLPEQHRKASDTLQPSRPAPQDKKQANVSDSNQPSDRQDTPEASSPSSKPNGAKSQAAPDTRSLTRPEDSAAAESKDQGKGRTSSPKGGEMGTRPQGKQEPATAGRMGDQQGGPSQDSSNQSEGQSPAQQGPEGQSSRGKETPGSPSSSAAAGKPASGNAAGQEGDESNGPDSAKPSESGTSSRAPKPGVKESAAKQNDPSGRPTESSPSAAESPPKDTEPPAKNGGDATSPPGADPRTASGGNVGVRPPARNGDSNDVASGDEPNLEYARRVTDLVLEYLRDQRDRPDRRLLNDLGWTAEDMRRFLDRWQQLRKSAQEDPAAQNEWEESLRSLGLRPVQDRVRRASGSQDDLRGLRESGLRSAPPLQYQDQLEAFKKGTARQER